MEEFLPSQRSALILYGTETGTSQDFAQEASKTLERHLFDVEVNEFDNVVPQTLNQYTFVVLVLSTTGQGDFPSNARRFWTSLLRRKLASTFLSDVTYVLVGLGDSSYPKFNWAARKLAKRIQQLGATSLLDPCEADEQGEDSTDGALIAWSQSFESLLYTRFPLPSGITPILEEELVSKWTLVLSTSTEPTNGSNGAHHVDHQAERSLQHHGTVLKVVLECNDRVTPENHWQDVRFLKLRTQERAAYLPGDVIAIRPKNNSEDVEELLKLMQWEHAADRKLRFQFNRKGTKSQRLPDESFAGENITLRQLLTHNLDISAIPRRSFFASIARFTQDEMHKNRLLEFINPEYLDEYYDYATRPRRSILEILQEFDSVKIPWQEVINVFPVLRPRQFSIASGGQLKEDGTSFELLVAIVKYRTVIKRIREGVCTRYLARLPVGSTLEVKLKTEGRLHTSSELQNNHHILIGAGTGIAPLRAIVHEKQMLLDAQPTTLIFGCRNMAADYFFKDEWEIISNHSNRADVNALQVITAFSRDQKQKFYIQDRIRENSRMIKRLLLDEDATIIVCGSSGAMPKAVREALVDALCKEEMKGDGDDDGDDALKHDEAEQYMSQLEKIGRYKQETW